MIPPLVLRIYADSTGVKKGVAQAQTQVSGLRASVIKNAGLIKTGLAIAVVAGIAAAVKANSDLIESQNKANEIFGKSVDSVNKFAESAATSFGLAKGEALEAAAGFGAMFQSAKIAEGESASMSITMEKLAGDMASFNNVSPVDMLDKLRSGLAGMSRPLRTFGVFLSAARVDAEATRLGMKKTANGFTDAQKVVARYNIILQDTKKQQGDFQRTLGVSMPNQLRVLRAQLINLAEKIGAVVLPALTGLLKVLNLILGPLVAIADVLATSAWDRFGASLEAAGLTTGQATTKIKDMKDAMDESNASGRQLGGAMAIVERQTRVAQDVADSWTARMEALQVASDRANSRLVSLGFGIQRFTKVSEKDWKEWVAKTAENFDAVKNGFDSLATKAKVTASSIIREFNRQARTIANYRTNLQEVAARNIPDDILQQLIDMGVGGAKTIEVLANASDAKFARMVGAMRGAGQQTRALERQIDALRNSLIAIEGDYNATIHITQVGAVNAGGLIAGQRAGGGPVNRMQPYLVGEKGPELFVPATRGTIVANGSSGGDGRPVRVNVQLDRRHYVEQADYQAAYGGA